MTFPFGDIVTEGLQKSGYHSIITKGETQNPSKIKKQTEDFNHVCSSYYYRYL